MPAMNRSRRISLIAMFTALAIILNFAISIPAPYAPYLSYEVWEVPILVAVILMGFWSGTAVAALNAMILELHPGPLPTGPFYNLIAEVAMILGVLAALRVSRGKLKPVLVWAFATALGASLRTLVMTFVNAAVLPQPPPIGFGYSSAAVPAALVVIGAFNFTITLFTVPLSYSVARAILLRYRPVFALDMSL